MNNPFNLNRANANQPRHRAPWLSKLGRAVVLFLAGLALAAHALAERPAQHPSRLILKPKAGPAAVAALDFVDSTGQPRARLHRQYRELENIQVWELNPGQNRDALADELRASGRFEYVEPDFEVRVNATPNDPAFTSGWLWGMPKIEAPAAWDRRTDASSVVVGVIDSGIRYTHVDLASNMWRNPGEIPGNGIDDDGNGYIDDVFGINAITGSGNPMDDNGHGTHCAGTIGGVGNNGAGVAGVAWRVKLMALKFLAADGRGYTSDAIECINYARAKGAKVLNNSWGGGSFSRSLYDAIVAANNAGIVFVAAAGNDSSNTDIFTNYPSCYNVPNVVSVGASDSADYKAWFSNYGAQSVDVFAPGVDIYSTYSTSDTSYTWMQGTSMAAPHVSGMIAVLRAEYPGESAAQIIQRLDRGVDTRSQLSSLCVTGGRVNLRKSLGVTQRNPVAELRTHWITAMNKLADAHDALTMNPTSGVTGALDQSITAIKHAIQLSRAPEVASAYQRDLKTMQNGLEKFLATTEKARYAALSDKSSAKKLLKGIIKAYRSGAKIESIIRAGGAAVEAAAVAE